MVPSVLNHKGGMAIAPQALVAGNTIEGIELENLHKVGQTLEFRVMCAAFGAVTVFEIVPMGRLTGTDTWEQIGTQHAPDAASLQFDATDTIGAADLDGGSLRGSLPISRLPYDAYRLDIPTLTGANVVVAASYTVFDLHDQERHQKDHFLYAWNDDGHYEELNGTTNAVLP